MPDSDDRRHLVHILQMAYSGERAAALAYRGHRRSVRSKEEHQRIKKIEVEELHHREQVGVMLRELGEKPSAWREFKMLVIGRVLGFLCPVSGWFLPMYGAGHLESHNVEEYVTAAKHARACGQTQYVDDLLTMAEVEWEHERYFRAKVMSHRLHKFVRLWPSLPAKETIRQ